MTLSSKMFASLVCTRCGARYGADREVDSRGCPACHATAPSNLAVEYSDAAIANRQWPAFGPTTGLLRFADFLPGRPGAFHHARGRQYASRPDRPHWRRVRRRRPFRQGREPQPDMVPQGPVHLRRGIPRTCFRREDLWQRRPRAMPARRWRPTPPRPALPASLPPSTARPVRWSIRFGPMAR